MSPHLAPHDQPVGGSPMSTPALVTVLNELGAWRAGTVDEIGAALAAIGEEERVVRRKIDDAHRQLAALGSIRKEQEERLADLDEELTRRKRAGVRDALRADRTHVEARATALHALRARRDAELGAGLDAPHMAAAVAEYLDAQERAAGVRGAVAPAPEELLSAPARERLAPFLRAAAGPPPALDAAQVGVGIVVSVDPPEGPPEALLIVIPVPWAVYADALLREDDLCTLLAYRLVAAVHVLLTESGAPDALVRYADVQGSLALQVWLGDSPVAPDLRERVMEAIAGAVEGAPELVAAGLDVFAIWLAPELLAEETS